VSLQKPREIALELLLARQKTGKFVESLLDQALEKHSLKPEDRRFLQELLFGVARWQGTLDWLISHKTKDQPQQPAVQNLLRLALYQMFWLERVPGYAAVNETVEIAKSQGLMGPAKFINAVLRAYGREAEATRKILENLKVENPPIGHSHPDWLYRTWSTRWGKDKTIQLFEWNNSPPPLFARVNTLKGDAAGLTSRWQEEQVEFKQSRPKWINGAPVYQLLSHPPLAQLRSFQDGLFYIQDPSTLLAPEMLQPQPGEYILDLCSAPGGKTTYLAQQMNNQGRIVAQDIDPDRLKLVHENARRLGADIITTEAPADAIYDRILIDAPCSNTGVMRRRVDLRWRVKPDEIKRLALVQMQLLKQAARKIRDGGTIVYSTCSLEREENSAIIREFLAGHSSFTLIEERELLPMVDGVDGAYVAKLLAR
jgi:16S rRNA (cytosine967-C5)-methyltransferase